MMGKLWPLMIIALLLVCACKPSEQTMRVDDINVSPEVRALWVARFSYQSPEDVRTIIRNAADHHFNVVLFQVRGNATVFYPSELEPWAWELTGEDPSTLGTDPGWDPLQLACDEAQRRGLELHAWINVFPAWRDTIPPPAGREQLWNTRREWFMQNGEGEVMFPQDWWAYWYAFLDPGVPEVKQHLHDVALEIVHNYPVDGLHFDYVRYPSEVGDWAYNPTSVARFAQLYKDYPTPTPATYQVQWSEWKRTQITEIVEAVYRDATWERPGLTVTAAVIHDWPRGHNDYAQDARRWLARGTLDATTPMLYTYPPAEFRYVAREHLEHAYGRWVLPGLNAGRSDAAELTELIEISRALKAKGVALFSYDGLFPAHEANAKAKALLVGPFSRRSRVPARDW